MCGLPRSRSFAGGTIVTLCRRYVGKKQHAILNACSP